ncbi:MAG: arginase family protein, partial [Pseudomonadota bacterium]
NKLQQLAKINHQIAKFTSRIVANNQAFLVLSGEHSSAMGSWAGAQNGLTKHSAKAKLGLIWLDAHLDAHTLHSSPSGNFHGMPVSALLGKAEPELLHAYPSNFFFSAETLLLYGIRSFEKSEKQLINDLNVKFYSYNKSPEQYKKTALFLHKSQQLIKQCDAIGISLDLDIVDPAYAPAVETDVAGGVTIDELMEILSIIKNSAEDKFIGLEITEFNPIREINHKTEKLILQIISKIFS